MVSIRAARAGRDLAEPASAYPPAWSFYPRGPSGPRPEMVVSYRHLEGGFYPRGPSGPRLGYRWVQLFVLMFLSARPERAATASAEKRLTG